MQLRQEAYHRLQWLRSEGERLAHENERLQGRLKQLKDEQRNQITKAEQIEQQAEDTRAQLEATEANLQEQLEDLNQSIDRSMVMEETAMRIKHDTWSPPEDEKRRGVRKEGPKKREGWNKKAAQDIESEIAQDTMQSEVSKVSLHSKASKPGTIRKKMKAKMKSQASKRDTSPFHFSPIKSPPQAAAGGRPVSINVFLSNFIIDTKKNLD